MKKLCYTIVALCLTFSLSGQTFQEFAPEFGSQHCDIGIADIDADGDLDVIIGGRTGGNNNDTLASAIFINDGNAVFSALASNPIASGKLATYDFTDLNGDGSLDVIFNGWNPSKDRVDENDETTNGIAFNDGTGGFTVSTDFEINTSAPTCGFADFNNDARMDYYMMGNGADQNIIYIQNANGTFTANRTSFADQDFTDPDVNILDFNKDGYLDMFINGFDDVAQTRVSALFINNTYGNLAKVEQAAILPKGYGSSTWADVDGNGRLDLLLNGDGGFDSGEASNDIYRLYKNVNGTLEEAATFNDYRQISVGDGARFLDFDNDGDYDIILTGWSITKARQATVLYECTDAASFTYEENTSWGIVALPGVSESSMEIADLNNDGKVDIILTGFSGSGVEGRDDANNLGLSRNIVGYTLNNTTTANTKPNAPTNLVTKAISGGFKFEWDVATDAETPDAALTYQFCVRNKTTGKWLIGPNAFVDGEKAGLRQVTGLGNVSINTRWWLYDLSGGTYEWSVQAIDGAYAGSTFAPFQEFTVEGSTSINESVASEQWAEISADNQRLSISIKQTIDNASLEVFDANGKRLYNMPISSRLTTLPISINNQVIIVKVMNNGEIQLQKMVIN